MFAMEKIKRCEIYAVLLSIGFLLLGGWGFVKGGVEIIADGFMNEPFPSIVMVVSVGLAIVFAFVAKKNANGKMDAKAVAGLVLGLVAIVVILCFAAAVLGIFAMVDTLPQTEMMTFLEENVKPMMEGNEASYDKIMEAVKAVYAAKGAK